MRESIFQNEWKDAWRFYYPESHFCKIPDMPRSAESRFIPQKPYDCFALLHGRYFAMELKLMTKIQAFPFNRVSEWQVANLKEARRNDAHAYIVINYRSQKIPERTRKKYRLEKRVNLVFVIAVDEFDRFDKESDRASIAFEDLYRLCDVYIRKQDKHWYIPELVMGETLDEPSGVV